MSTLEPADGVLLISLERQCHLSQGYDLKHDLEHHTTAELVDWAASYVFRTTHTGWTRCPQDVTVEQLAKAGSLIAAAIDRIIAEESQR